MKVLAPAQTVTESVYQRSSTCLVCPQTVNEKVFKGKSELIADIKRTDWRNRCSFDEILNGVARENGSGFINLSSNVRDSVTLSVGPACLASTRHWAL